MKDWAIEFFKGIGYIITAYLAINIFCIVGWGVINVLTWFHHLWGGTSFFIECIPQDLLSASETAFFALSCMLWFFRKLSVNE